MLENARVPSNYPSRFNRPLGFHEVIKFHAIVWLNVLKLINNFLWIHAIVGIDIPLSK